jgi:hypothetical protein
MLISLIAFYVAYIIKQIAYVIIESFSNYEDTIIKSGFTIEPKLDRDTLTPDTNTMKIRDSAFLNNK